MTCQRPANPFTLTQVLRNEWGFRGIVLSDALAVGNLEMHGFARDPQDAAYKAISAGVNMDMASLTYPRNLAKLVAEGKVSESYLDELVLPILEAKYDLGLFDHPYVDESRVDAVLSRPEGLALARKLAGRSMVLLRNENHVLPLSKRLKNVAVIGPLADSDHDIEGGWTVEGLFGGTGKCHPVTVYAGIKNKLGPAAQVTLVPGPEPWRIYPGFLDVVEGRKLTPPPTREEAANWIEKAKAAAAHADMVVAVMGEMASMNGEAASRHLDLPGIQQQMLEAVVATGKPVVLVLENGRPLDIRWAAEHVPAILERRGIRGRRVATPSRTMLFGSEPRRKVAGELASLRGRGASLLQSQPDPRSRRPACLRVTLLGRQSRNRYTPLAMGLATRHSNLPISA
jgi:beta-glucosidase